MNSYNNIKPINILLLENNSSTIRVAQKALGDARPYNNLTIIMNSEDAILYLKKTDKFKNAVTPDIILLDLKLPMGGGLEVLKEIASDPILKVIPVIILTSSVSEKIALKWLLKPPYELNN
jgi:chemotaxis family two-component system response regulator Rcp1